MSDFSKDSNWKLRVVVDKELNPGQQLAQAMHAAIEFLMLHQELSSSWHQLSNSVVIMSATGEELVSLLRTCSERQVASAYFREPDMEHKLTAICLAPTRESKRITSNLRLALGR